MLGDLRARVEQRKGQRHQLEADLAALEEKGQALNRRVRRAERARVVLQEVARLTQDELKYQVGDLVSAALEAVFPDPYHFELEFVERRNKTEADLWFVRGEERIRPIDAAGGGAVDVAAFALRVALWCLQSPRGRACLIMDEPFRFLSVDLLSRAAEMLQQISEQLGLQFILVSHSDELIDGADRVFRVAQRKGRSVLATEEERGHSEPGHPRRSFLVAPSAR